MLHLENINFDPPYVATDNVTIYSEAMKDLKAEIDMIPIKWNRNDKGEPRFVYKDGKKPHKDQVPLLNWNSSEEKKPNGFLNKKITALDFQTGWNRGGNTIAVKTGHFSNIFMFDFDYDPQNTLSQFLVDVSDILSNDEIFLEKTISNGYHLYVRLKENESWDGLSNQVFAYCKGIEKPRIECRGEGGCSFCYPSRGYRKIEGFAPSLAELKRISRGGEEC